jgi:membrane protein DedA with SNARE-associated domain
MHLHIQYLLQHYGYQGVFIALFLEMIGIPFPGETILTLSGIAWKQGTFSLLPLIFVAWAGNIIGSIIAYLIGRFFGRTIIVRFGKYIYITEEKLNAKDKLFNKYKVPIILFGKFIAGIRVLVGYLSGINRIDFWKYFLYNAIGSFIWVVVFVVFGRYVEILWQHFHQTLQPYLYWLIGIVPAAYIAVLLKKRLWKI